MEVRWFAKTPQVVPAFKILATATSPCPYLIRWHPENAVGTWWVLMCQMGKTSFFPVFSSFVDRQHRAEILFSRKTRRIRAMRGLDKNWFRSVAGCQISEQNGW